MVAAGNAPKVKAVPIAVRQHHQPILDQREEQKDAAGRIGFQNMRSKGVMIGSDDPKKVPKVPARASSGPVGGAAAAGVKNPPMRFTMCKKQPKGMQ